MKIATSIIENLEARFPDAEFICNLKIFDIRVIATPVDDQVDSFGSKEIKEICNFLAKSKYCYHLQFHLYY